MDMNLQWRRATYSSSNGGNCIEVATADHTVSVRDSKDPNGPCLAFGVRAWQAFATKLRGERSLHPLRRAGCQNQSETWSGPLLADRAGCGISSCRIRGGPGLGGMDCLNVRSTSD